MRADLMRCLVGTAVAAGSPFLFDLGLGPDINDTGFYALLLPVESRSYA